MKAGGFTTDRDRAASAAVGSTMLVLGGRVDRQEKEEDEEEEETGNVSKVHISSPNMENSLLNGGFYRSERLSVRCKGGS